VTLRKHDAERLRKRIAESRRSLAGADGLAFQRKDAERCGSPLLLVHAKAGL